MNPADDVNPLPYVDSKPQGAADFYLAINATFRFLIRRFGLPGWQRYLGELAENYYRPVWEKWQADGLPAVASYLRSFFAAEPCAEVAVNESGDRVVLDVKVCPAIKHLRTHQCVIVPEFCQHCYYQGQAMAAHAGMEMRLEGGAGSCCQTFYSGTANLPPQDMAAIARVES